MSFRSIGNMPVPGVVGINGPATFDGVTQPLAHPVFYSPDELGLGTGPITIGDGTLYNSFVGFLEYLQRAWLTGGFSDASFSGTVTLSPSILFLTGSTAVPFSITASTSSTPQSWGNYMQVVGGNPSREYVWESTPWVRLTDSAGDPVSDAVNITGWNDAGNVDLASAGSLGWILPMDGSGEFIVGSVDSGLVVDLYDNIGDARSLSTSVPVFVQITCSAVGNSACPIKNESSFPLVFALDIRAEFYVPDWSPGQFYQFFTGPDTGATTCDDDSNRTQFCGAAIASTNADPTIADPCGTVSMAGITTASIPLYNSFGGGFSPVSTVNVTLSVELLRPG